MKQLNAAFSAINAMLLLTSVIVLLSIFTPSTFAQPINDPCGCNAVLVDGVFSYRMSRGDNAAEKDIETIIKNSTYDDYQKTLQAGGGASYAGYGFNANMSRGEYEAHRTEKFGYSREHEGSKSSQELLERYGDHEVLISSFNCKKQCNVRGIVSWVDFLDKDNFVLNINWTPFIGPTSPNPRIRMSSLSNARADFASEGQLARDGYEIFNGQNKFTIHREDSKQAVVMTAIIPGMDVVEYVSPFTPVLPPPKGGGSDVRDPLANAEYLKTYPWVIRFAGGSNEHGLSVTWDHRSSAEILMDWLLNSGNQNVAMVYAPSPDKSHLVNWVLIYGFKTSEEASGYNLREDQTHRPDMEGVGHIALNITTLCGGSFTRDASGVYQCKK